MIKIWEFSEHVYENPASDFWSCDCRHYLNICIDAIRALWDIENYILFDTAMYRFQFCRSEFVLNNEFKKFRSKIILY